MSEHLLALETSCDETAVAIVSDGGQVVASRVHTQIDLHALYGGVVPELASRDHLARILPLVDETLREAEMSLEEMTCIAATAGPGLVGALLVGLQTAKGLALASGRPLVGINHLEAHLAAILLEDEWPTTPFLALLVSGGHTTLYEVQDASGGEGDRERWSVRRIGGTRDDAAGEAFDKSARLLGLPYPGGRALDQLAAGGDPEAVPLPRGMMHRPEPDFSFSGLKTAVRLHVEREGVPEGQALADLCASIRAAIVEPLVKKTVRAAEGLGVNEVLLCGGVAANGTLRQTLEQALAAEGRRLFVPRPAYCTDNAAMVGAAGWMAFRGGGRSPMNLNADPGWKPGGVGPHHV
ncbi:MAG: tRNA (adenosine(37)-N6)-threonylcarbamoyltransferase complex transferase subunit TsaD [Deltaproteobacteria bacterium]|nr:tRNA (adenosine(37)-N6)-threonylcarbamoyltransferase complex transferase subunit TsaD [Deltaproteobacteria bacterium]